MGSTCEDLMYMQLGEKFGGGMMLPGLDAIRDFLLEQASSMQRSGREYCVCVCVCVCEVDFLCLCL